MRLICKIDEKLKFVLPVIRCNIVYWKAWPGTQSKSTLYVLITICGHFSLGHYWPTISSAIRLIDNISCKWYCLIVQIISLMGVGLTGQYGDIMVLCCFSNILLLYLLWLTWVYLSMVQHAHHPFDLHLCCRSHSVAIFSKITDGNMDVMQGCPTAFKVPHLSSFCSASPHNGL